MSENQTPDLLQQVEQLKAELATAMTFYTLTVRQRDNAWLEIEKLEKEIDRLRGLTKGDTK
jgi:hypothetical protein